jgi:peptidoglycan/LPS O-acetylase OafA/YrhL
MLAQTVLNLSLYLLFVALGYWVSGKMPPPRTTQTWILWLLLVVFAGGVCVSGYAVNINNAVILRTNDMLQAIGIGILIGFVIAKSKQDKPTTI